MENSNEKRGLFESRPFSLLIISVIYAAAYVPGYFLFDWAKDAFDSYLLAALVFDVFATLAVWLSGVILRNSSVYDPYWSVTPMAVALAILCSPSGFLPGTSGALTPAAILSAAAVLFWGTRLTANWIYTFKNIRWQDWRYVQYKQNNPKLWFLINLFGINMMPTLFVFAGMIPMFKTFDAGGGINAVAVLGAAVSIGAAVLQLFSDISMHRFKLDPENAGKVNDKGLWSWSRHPNYFGEIAFWWGLYFIMLSVAPEFWWLFVCPLSITLLFLFISIPLMEKRQLARRPEYAAYKKRTSMLVPFPPKKNTTPSQAEKSD